MWGAPRELQYLLVLMQASASAEAPALEEHKHSSSVQSLLVLLETGYDEQYRNKVKEHIGSRCSQSGRPTSDQENAQLQLLPLFLRTGS